MSRSTLDPCARVHWQGARVRLLAGGETTDISRCSFWTLTHRLGHVVASLDLLTAYRSELDAGYRSLESEDFAEAFRRFERAHILGQSRTRLHVQAHIAMFRVARVRRDRRELVGQLQRIVAAALFSRIWVPQGNTGGANVNAFRRMAVPEDLKRILDRG